MWNYPENPFADSSSRGQNNSEEDEEGLKWAALRRLPTYIQVRTSILKNISDDVSQVDITKIGKDERNLVLDRLVAALNDDPEMFFNRLRQRFDVVGISTG